MGRKSTKTNKNIYQTTREALGLTREEASELLGFVSADRIEKIESGKATAHPDEVRVMSEKYNSPSLCNYYCSRECAIGEKYVPEIKEKENLPQIVLEILSSLNSLEKSRNVLIDISADGEIQDHEIADLIAIQDELERISITVETLQIWVEKRLSSGEINREQYERFKKEQ